MLLRPLFGVQDVRFGASVLTETNSLTQEYTIAPPQREKTSQTGVLPSMMKRTFDR